jgi:uncharacterized DUF497 family protein
MNCCGKYFIWLTIWQNIHIIIRKYFLIMSELLLMTKTTQKKEERFYYIGNDGNGILTVRFTMRNGNIRIFGAGYWREGEINMCKNTNKVQVSRLIQ